MGNVAKNVGFQIHLSESERVLRYGAATKLFIFDIYLFDYRVLNNKTFYSRGVIKVIAVTARAKQRFSVCFKSNDDLD